MAWAIVQAYSCVRKIVFGFWQKPGLTRGALAGKAEEAGVVFMFALCKQSGLEQVDKKCKEKFERRCLVRYPAWNY